MRCESEKKQKRYREGEVVFDKIGEGREQREEKTIKDNSREA